MLRSFPELPELPVTVPSVRLFLAVSAASLIAACGGTKPEPLPAPAEPAAQAANAGDAAAEVPAEDHDHGGEHAGGEAHVHGLADLAITREGNRFMGELISPMANFGLSETDAAYTDIVTAELSGLVEVDGGDCQAGVPHPMTDDSGEHTDAVVHFVWTCAKPDEVRAVRFAGFTAFPVFEKVSAIYITDAEQKAGDLTPSAPELALK